MRTSETDYLGLPKEGVIARQFLLGAVQTADGLPVNHEVFDGNASEGPTLKPTLEHVLQRHPHVKRLVVVADRGLLSLDNLQMLSELKLPDAKSLEFILGVPGRRHGDFVELLAPLQAKAEGATNEVVDELSWRGHCLVVAHNPEQARELTQPRRERIAILEARAQPRRSNVPAVVARREGVARQIKDLARLVSNSGGQTLRQHHQRVLVVHHPVQPDAKEVSGFGHQIPQEPVPETTILERIRAQRLPGIAIIHAGSGAFAGPTQ